MDRNTFLALLDVQAFLNWLSIKFGTIQICLNIAQSRFVTRPIIAQVTGIENVLPFYLWRSTGMHVGNWLETKARLTELSNLLRNEVNRGDNNATLQRCRDILTWGGNRNWNVGAYPFLNGMSREGALCEYLQNTGNAFSLANANTTVLCPPVGRMNAMLSKVHALYSTDGLPIYDSRVAAAIASLVEVWRDSTGNAGAPLHAALTFPATLRSRTVLRRLPHATHPGVMTYGAPNTCAQWSSAKVRLGWIMERFLEQHETLFVECCQNPTLADRMHAFEASLFMIGYNVTCLNYELGVRAQPPYGRAFKSLVPEPFSRAIATKTALPLSGRGTPVNFSGSLETGFDVQWGSLHFVLEPDFLVALQGEFDGREGVPLGANMTGTVPADSLGQWIANEGWPSRRFVSAIAAVLVAEGVIASFMIKRGIRLNFGLSGA